MLKQKIALLLCLLTSNMAFSEPDSIPRVLLVNGSSAILISEADVETLNQLIVSHDWQKAELHNCWDENTLLAKMLDANIALVYRMRGDSVTFEGIIEAQEVLNTTCTNELEAERNRNKLLKGFCWGLGGFGLAAAIIAAVFGFAAGH